MELAEQVRFELAGVVLLVVAGIFAAVVTAVISPFWPWVDAGWVLVATIAAVWYGT